MTDLVARLIRLGTPISREAADRIEELERELGTLRKGKKDGKAE